MSLAQTSSSMRSLIWAFTKALISSKLAGIWPMNGSNHSGGLARSVSARATISLNGIRALTNGFILFGPILDKPVDDGIPDQSVATPEPVEGVPDPVECAFQPGPMISHAQPIEEYH